MDNQSTKKQLMQNNRLVYSDSMNINPSRRAVRHGSSVSIFMRYILIALPCAPGEDAFSTVWRGSNNTLLPIKGNEIKEEK